MPSLEMCKKLMGGSNTIGQMHKMQSDNIMNATWWNDIQSRVAYLYDYYHDKNPSKLRDMKSPEDNNKIPVDIKYIKHTSQTMDKDNITFHLQFRPGATCEVPYYQEYVRMYDLEYPLGLYVDIPDEAGIYNRWMIVAKANAYNTQFIDYEILPCDYTVQYILNHEKHQIASVLRSQNSSIRRFIGETLCQKFSNCRNPLRVNMLQRKIEIFKRDSFKKLLNWEIRSEVPNRKTFNDQVLK